MTTQVGIRSNRLLAVLIAFLICLEMSHAGGPKYVAGAHYFQNSVQGQPLRWAAGIVHYRVDQGSLTGSISNQQAVQMVDAAAALWSAVPTAAIRLVNDGALAEDVNGATIVAAAGGLQAPVDASVAAAATTQVAVVFDMDGAVIDALQGATSSQPGSCEQNGVVVLMDQFNMNATLGHAVMILNGLCATTNDQTVMMAYEVERAWGRILGLDYAQVNPTALAAGLPGGTLGWPVMQPMSGVCGNAGGACIPNPNVLRWDDVAALSRLYPVTTANQASFSGKQLTAANTVSISGTIKFRSGAGMQGVNVTAIPLDASGQPLYQYAASAVSGQLFNGNHGNPVTGWVDAAGNRLDMWGSGDAQLAGSFDLSAIPLPPGMASADYEIRYEAINPLYINANTVGPYVQGQPAPSGTLATVTLRGLAAGATNTVPLTVADSAAAGEQSSIGTATEPRQLPPSGMWHGLLGQVGQSDWYNLPVRGGRSFSVVAIAQDETGAASGQKAMPVIGIWDAADAAGIAPVAWAPALSGYAIGESLLRVQATSDGMVRLGVADERGDGRPDYSYTSWVLYADTISPQRLGAAGGLVLIQGRGFRAIDTVRIGGQQATVVSISPTEILAIAPSAAPHVTGSVDVEVDDDPLIGAVATIAGGISYDAGNGDALHLNTAPMNAVAVNVPLPFSVTAYGADGMPAGGVTILYTVISGTARLGCPSATTNPALCTVAATGDGRASINVTAMDGTTSIVTAALMNGAKVQAEFYGTGTAPTMTAMTPTLSVVVGATVQWPVQVLVQQSGRPLSGQSVQWQTSGGGITSEDSATAMTDANGLATKMLTVGPLKHAHATTTVQACVNGGASCVTFTVLAVDPNYAWLQAVSGTTQSVALNGTPADVVFRAMDPLGNPVAGASVSYFQTVYAWAPDCPAHGVCAQPEMLAQAAAQTAVSAVDGTISFQPATRTATATTTLGLASTGSSLMQESSLTTRVVRHP